MLKRLIINKHFKFQFEKLQNSHVLLYPEGRILLNDTATEIFKLCDGKNDIKGIKAELEKRYDNVDGLDDFVKEALTNKWLKEVIT